MISLWISLLCRWLSPLESSLRLYMNIITCFLERNITWLVQVPGCERTLHIILGNATALLHAALLFFSLSNAQLEFWNITCHLEKCWTVNMDLPSAHTSSKRSAIDEYEIFCLYVTKKSTYVLSALHQNFKQHHHLLMLAILLVSKIQNATNTLLGEIHW